MHYQLPATRRARYARSRESGPTTATSPKMPIDPEVSKRVRNVLTAQAQLRTGLDQLADEQSLYDAGMTSRASVSVMLGLEGEFDIEFPDTMLRRDVFESVAAISQAVSTLLGQA